MKKKQKIYENFEFSNFEILESNGSIDDLGKAPTNVLAVVKGPSFVPDGFSRNGRFYPKELWSNALKNPNFQRKLKRKLVFGCIGHPVGEYNEDELLQSGKVSHVVTDMKIENNQGVTEFHILDTPAGRILNTILKAGSKPYVSTRAYGGFTNETKEKDGKVFKVLDKDNFMIESVDFVIEPGFLEASPKLIENFYEDFKKINEDPKKIVCEDGICEIEKLLENNPKNLKNEKNENEKNEKNENEKNEKNKLNKEKNKNDINEEILKDLNKDEIIEMFKNLSSEYKQLLKVQENENNKNNNKKNKNKIDQVSQSNLSNQTQNQTNLNQNKNKKSQSKDQQDQNKNGQDNQDKQDKQDDQNIEKNQTLFIAYLELLIKLLKYNINYRNNYNELIKFLDIDSRIKNKDIQKIIDILDEISNSKKIDEPTKKLINILKDLAKNPLVKQEEFLKEYSNYLKNIFEKYKDYYKIKMINSSLKKSILNFSETIEFINQKNNDFKNKIEEQKEIIKTLIQKLNENQNKEKNYDDLLEKFNNSKKEIFELKEKNKEIKNNLFNGLNFKNKELLNKNEKLLNENKELRQKMKLNEKIKEEHDKISEAYEFQENQLKKLNNDLKILDKKVKKLLIEKFSLIFKRLDKFNIENVCKNLDYDEEKIFEELTKLEKRVPKSDIEIKKKPLGISEKKVKVKNNLLDSLLS